MSQHRSIRVLLLHGTMFSALALPFATAAMAQDAANSAAKGANEEIVVTGTQIRGIAPVGTESVTISTEQITEAPGLTTNDVLATVPQISNFFSAQLGINSGLGTGAGIDTPSIHGLPTLIMLDGHRIASAGSNLTSIDPSIIPKGILSGIEVVPDGGSALYGSDAIGGVINFTTKKRFNGFDVDGDVGLDSGSQQYRLNATVGKEWNEGSVYLSYAFDKQTPLFGRDRPYIHYIGLNNGCSPSTVTPQTLQPMTIFGFTFLAPAASTTHYTVTGIGANGKPTGFAAGAPENCNEYTNESLTSEEHQHSLFGGWSQDITQSITVDTRAFYSKRDSKAYNVFNTTSGNLSQGATVPTSNFYYTPTPAEGAGPYFGQAVGFSYVAPGANQPSTSDLQEWGVSSTITADLGHDFQARLLGNYSKSNFKSVALGVDPTLLASALASNNMATALDAYDPQANPQSALVAHEIDSQKSTAFGQTNEYQARLVMDGPLFHLPAGQVKIAVGGEVLRDSTDLGSSVVNFAGANNSAPQNITGARTVASAFGELNVPLVSPDNNMALIHKLDFSAAGRYDHYSDFGSTFNPRLALSYLPSDWFTVRGTWGHSFIAPALYSEFSPQQAIVAGGNAFILPNGDTADLARNLIVLEGGNPNLLPEKSQTYTLGGDLKVPFVDGLKLSLTYYHTRYTDNLTTAPLFNGNGALFTGQYNNFFIQNPTLAQVQALAGNAIVSGNSIINGAAITNLAQLYGAGGASGAASPSYIEDGRYGNNPGLTYVSGLDFSASYRYPTSWGALNASISGNYQLQNKSNLAIGQPFIDALANASVFRGTVSFGANVGDFHGNATLEHTSGYSFATASPTGQTSVSAYNVVNTAFSYTLNGASGMVKGTELRFDVQNLLNARPVVNTSGTTGYGNQSLLGRVFELGFHKKF